MTPGINIARKAGIRFQVHEYTHDPKSEAYGQEAAEKLGLPPDRVFKTLVLELDSRELVVVVLPVSRMLSMKLIARAAGAKKASMAQPQLVARSTGYVLGGVSPLGQKKPLRTWIDSSARGHSTIFVSAGRRGLEIELSPGALRDLTNASFCELSQDRTD
ncbi:Cys-tRNA(Pro) deacylase [Marinobacter salicampi]|uniref:Cys-tRNA(Pro) deacylase n=1 Tax=Marinobacter salicampi TaxID=435907 RepID=UPI00140E50C9|nr:Cys-tRNA(Pro) deacylase [Marinobacter salicampi]